MKVYGFDETDVLRGEMRAATVDAALLRFMEEVKGRFGWEFASTRFPEVKAKLIERMKEECVDQEMIDLAKTLKASYIPVD